jgi:serine protease
VIAVAALARTGARASYSLTGPAISVSAFGGEIAASCFNADIVTTLLSYNHLCYDGPGGNTTYTSGFSGTSAAAPQVSGVAALLLSREPNLTAAQVKSRIMTYAVPWGDATQFGAGKLDAFATISPLIVTVSGPTYIDTPGTYTWTAQASGGVGGYSYQWQVSYNNGATWGPIGTNSPSYSENETANGSFRLRTIVTSGTRQATSNALSVTVQVSGCSPQGC